MIGLLRKTSAIAIPRPTIAVIGDSLAAFGLGYPRGMTATEPDWLRFLGGVSYNMPTGAGAQVEFRASDSSVRWTAPSDTAGPWTALRPGLNFLESGTAGYTVCLGIRMDFLPDTDATVSATVTATNRGYRCTAYWNYLQILTGHKLKIVGLHGIGGDRTRHMLARIGQVFSINELDQPIDELPGYVLIMGGTNDVVADDLGAADIGPNLRAMANYVLARGARPILCTVTARDGITSQEQSDIYAVNAFIRNLAASDERIILVDLYNISRDPADSDASSITDYLYDGTHASNLGGYILGAEVARVLLPQIGGVIGRARSRFVGDPENLQPNGALAGTTGTSSNAPGGAPTQQVADGYTVSRSTGSALTISATKQAVTGELDWQVLTCASAAAGDTAQLGRTTMPTIGSLGLAAGDTIYAEAEVDVSAATGLRRVDLLIQLYDGTQGKNVGACASQDSASSEKSLPASSAFSGLLRTPDVVIPTGVTQIRVYARAVFSGSGEAVVKFRSLGLFEAS